MVGVGEGVTHCPTEEEAELKQFFWESFKW